MFFNSPTDVVEKHIAPGSRIRLGGLVEPGSLDARRQSRGPLRGHRRQRASAGGLSRASCPTCSAKGRAWWPRARSTRPAFQGRHRARQARRDLHAEGSRRRAEEAGALEERGRLRARPAQEPKGKNHDRRSSAITRWCWRWRSRWCRRSCRCGARARNDATLMGVADSTALAQFVFVAVVVRGADGLLCRLRLLGR